MRGFMDLSNRPPDVDLDDARAGPKPLEERWQIARWDACRS